MVLPLPCQEPTGATGVRDEDAIVSGTDDGRAGGQGLGPVRGPLDVGQVVDSEEVEEVGQLGLGQVKDGDRCPVAVRGLGLLLVVADRTM
jgi:hypothetical protein